MEGKRTSYQPSWRLTHLNGQNLKSSRELNQVMIFEDQKTSICQVRAKKKRGASLGVKGIPDQEKRVPKSIHWSTIRTLSTNNFLSLGMMFLCLLILWKLILCKGWDTVISFLSNAISGFHHSSPICVAVYFHLPVPDLSFEIKYCLNSQNVQARGDCNNFIEC